VAAAQALVAKYVTRPSSVGVTQAVGKPIPKGEVVDYMDFDIPQSAPQLVAIKQAAGLLGWTVRDISMGATPQGVHAAWTQVAANPPSGVIMEGLPRVLFNQQLATVAAHGTKVVVAASTDTAGNGLSFCLACGNGQPDGTYLQGQVEAAWVTADTQGKANTLMVYVPEEVANVTELQGFQAEYGSNCSGCSLATLSVAETDIPSNVPTKVVGYLRAHPDVNYLVFGTDNAVQGVPTALAQAGLASHVKIIGDGPASFNNADIANGKEAAGMGYPQTEVGWRLMDALARLFAGAPTDPANGPLPYMLLTKQNIATIGPIDQYNSYVPQSDIVSQFKTVWGVS
jgi:ribose transport system substrate-binding protein